MRKVFRTLSLFRHSRPNVLSRTFSTQTSSESQRVERLKQEFIEDRKGEIGGYTREEALEKMKTDADFMAKIESSISDFKHLPSFGVNLEIKESELDSMIDELLVA